MRNRNTLLGVILAAGLTGMGCGGPEEIPADTGDDLLDEEDGGKADSAGPKTITITEAKNGKTVTARVGDTVEVRLAGNPTTGYQWKVVSQSKSLPIASQKYIPGQPAQVGSGGVYSFVLKPDLLAAGGKHLTSFAYYRSWEGVASAIKLFSVTISVKPATVKCGSNVCAAGQVCCNASCGICTPPGGYCTQQACGPVLAKEGEACKSFGNPTLPECEAGLICQPGPIPDTAHCVKPSCQQTGCAAGKQCVPCKTTSGWDFFCIPVGAMC
jgi:predicted secreted protein